MGRKLKLDRKGEFYIYKKSGQYVRQKLASRRGCVKYRYKEIKPGVLLLICVTKKKGKKGGKTKAVALLRHVNRDLRHYVKREPKVYNALKKARKLRSKED